MILSILSYIKSLLFLFSYFSQLATIFLLESLLNLNFSQNIMAFLWGQQLSCFIITYTLSCQVYLHCYHASYSEHTNEHAVQRETTTELRIRHAIYQYLLLVIG